LNLGYREKELKFHDSVSVNLLIVDVTNKQQTEEGYAKMKDL